MKTIFKVKCPICNRDVQGKVKSPMRPGPEHAFMCPYWREDPEENSDPLDDVVTEALKTEGFGVVADSMCRRPCKEILDKNILPYHILGVFNPSLCRGEE